MYQNRPPAAYRGFIPDKETVEEFHRGNANVTNGNTRITNGNAHVTKGNADVTYGNAHVTDKGTFSQ